MLMRVHFRYNIFMHVGKAKRIQSMYFQRKRKAMQK